MTFETPEGKSITWSNIKKDQKTIISDSYVHNCPNSLCMISKLEFVFRNVPSGLRNSVSLLSSQYPRRPEVLPAMTIYLSTLNIGYLLRFFSLSIKGVRYVMLFRLYAISQLPNALRLVNLGGHPSVTFSKSPS